MIATLATALLLAADPQPPRPPPVRAGEPAQAPPPALSPEDAAVVEHLELLEKLELLQDLEVVDTGDDGNEKPRTTDEK